MNPLYNMFNGMMNSMPQNPIQRALQAMMNPVGFVKQIFPDIPAQIQNDPNQILSYLQQTRNISNNDIQNLVSQHPYPGNNQGNYQMNFQGNGQGNFPGMNPINSPNQRW